MKYIISLFIFFSFYNFCLGSDNHIKSELIKNIKRIHYIGSTKKSFYCVRTGKKSTLFKINHNLNIELEKKINLKFVKHFGFLNSRIVNNEIHVLHTFKDEKTKFKHIFISKYNLDDFEFIEKKEIYKYRYTENKSYTQPGFFRFLESKNKSHRCLLLISPSIEMLTVGWIVKKEITIKVLDLDEEYNILKKKKFVVFKNNKDLTLSFKKGFLSDNNDLYFTYSYIDHNTVHSFYIDNRRDEILKLNNLISFEKGAIITHTFFINDGQLFILGYKFDADDNFIVFSINETGEVHQTKYNIYQTSISNPLLINSPKLEYNDNLILNNQNIHSVVKVKKGFALISETFIPVSGYGYEHYNILVTLFDNNGKVLWNEVIYKYTDERSISKLPFKVIANNNTLYFIYRSDYNNEYKNPYGIKLTKLTELYLDTRKQYTTIINQDTKEKLYTQINKSFYNKYAKAFYLIISSKNKGRFLKVNIN